MSIHAQQLAVDTSLTIAIATINAAVVAVVLGAVIAYGAIVLQREHELRDDVFDAASDVNLLQMRITTDERRVHDNADLVEGYDPRNKDQRNRLANRLNVVPESLWNDYTMAHDVTPDVGSRRAAAVMMIVGGTYPFPSTWTVTAGRWQTATFDPVPVRFSKLEEIDDWMEGVNTLAFLAPLHSFPRERLWNYLTAGDEIDHAGLMPSENDPPAVREHVASMRQGLVFVDVLAEYYRMVAEGAKIAHKTSLARERHRRYYELRLGKHFWARIFAIAVVALIVGLFGVLIPMVRPTAPRWMYAWLPAGVYLLAAIVAVISVLDHLLATHGLTGVGAALRRFGRMMQGDPPPRRGVT